jgi:hypothetical protein
MFSGVFHRQQQKHRYNKSNSFIQKKKNSLETEIGIEFWYFFLMKKNYYLIQEILKSLSVIQHIKWASASILCVLPEIKIMIRFF